MNNKIIIFLIILLSFAIISEVSAQSVADTDGTGIEVSEDVSDTIYSSESDNVVSDDLDEYILTANNVTKYYGNDTPLSAE